MLVSCVHMALLGGLSGYPKQADHIADFIVNFYNKGSADDMLLYSRLAQAAELEVTCSPDQCPQKLQGVVTEQCDLLSLYIPWRIVSEH